MKNRLLLLVVCLSLVFVASSDTLAGQPNKLPDLQVRFTAPATAFAGQNIGPKMTVYVRNMGRLMAKGTKTAGSNGYMVDLMLSKDKATPTGWATVSTTFKEDALLVGGRISVTADLKYKEVKKYSVGAKIPANTPPGYYYLVMYVDPGNKIDEGNRENNNRYLRKIRIVKFVPPNPCQKTYPSPVIYFKNRDAKGRVYIPVKNWKSYSNSMFAAAPTLPPCGKNKNSSRTWVDIYDARNNQRIYGFCAFDSADDLQKIWFMSKMRSGRVYIIIHDRACKKKYKSNILSWPR